MLYQREIVTTQNPIYYPAFDYLRITLATAVAAGHADLITWSQAGNLSVQVFFALSGWLIGGILLRSSPDDLPRFYFNRAARIWIPYFVAVAILIVVSLLRDTVTTKWIEIIFYKITFVYDFFGPPQLAEFGNAMPLKGTGNHLWSICAEEQFYLVAPIFITLLPLGRRIWPWSVLFVTLLFFPYWNLFASISLVSWPQFRPRNWAIGMLRASEEPYSLLPRLFFSL